MPINTPLDWIAGALASADMNDHIRDQFRWHGGYAEGSKGIAILSSSIAIPLTVTPGWTSMPMDTADYNNGEVGDLLWDAGAPELFVMPYDCIAMFGGGMRTEATTANKALRFILNGDDAMPLLQHDNIGVSTPAFTSIGVTRPFPFSAGDTIEMQGFQDAGVTINAIVEGKASPHMWCMWVAVNDPVA